MKTLTPPLIKFAIVAVLLTTSFRVLLSELLLARHFNFVLLLALVYGLAMFLSGRFFGKKDEEYLPIYDVGFRFHLVTFIQYHAVSYIWYLYGAISPSEKIGQLNTTFLMWGFFLLMHFFLYAKTRKNAIKHIKKEDLFE